MEQVLTVKNLSIGYGMRSIAQRINFQLDKAELCGIVGVNGIGKSTLLRTLAKLQPAIGGEIVINGIASSDFSPLQLAQNLALVLTEPIATKNLTVLELLALSRQPYTNWWGTLTKEDKVAIEQSLVQFDLENLKIKKCFELSDGQLQRVLIARAMAQNTPLIFLDEPTTHLDLSHKVHILKLLQELAHINQKTVLFTTHEIDLAIQLCDKMLILDGKENPFGEPCKLIEQGCFSALFSSELVEFDEKTGSFRVKK